MTMTAGHLAALKRLGERGSPLPALRVGVTQGKGGAHANPDT